MLNLFLDQILQDAQKHKGHILIRKQCCMGCNKVLAVEITDQLGARGEYWVAMGGIKFKTGIDLIYDKKVWFGNFIKCPNCGRQGRLPMDKPLNAENIALPREVKDAKVTQNASPKA